MSRPHPRVSNLPLNLFAHSSPRPSINLNSTHPFDPLHNPLHTSSHHPITQSQIPKSNSPRTHLTMTRRGAHTSSRGGQSGRGDGKSGGGRPPQSREVTVSRNLSYLLRHSAENEGIRLDEGGWANVADIVGDFSPSFFLCGGLVSCAL